MGLWPERFAVRENPAVQSSDGPANRAVKVPTAQEDPMTQSPDGPANPAVQQFLAAPGPARRRHLKGARRSVAAIGA